MGVKRRRFEYGIGNVLLHGCRPEGELVWTDSLAKELAYARGMKSFDSNSAWADTEDWDLIYHFSSQRGNLFRWYPLQQECSLLEIGAQTGAFTGLFARQVKHVDAVELLEQNCIINAYRNRDSSNLELHVGGPEAIPQKSCYDCVVLPNLSEYLYRMKTPLGDDSSLETFLSSISDLLKPGGMLLLASANRFGMRYWNGCKDSGQKAFFESIERRNTDYRLFSKKELTTALQNSGYPEMKFYYPYPDLQFPTSIYSDDHLPEPGELRHNLRNYSNDRLKLFEETGAYNQIIREEMFPFFSNAYFISAKKEA